MPTSNSTGKEASRKHCRKRRKCRGPAFSPFPTMLSTLSKTEIIILFTVNAFKLDKSKFLPFGKELKAEMTTTISLTAYKQDAFVKN